MLKHHLFRTTNSILTLIPLITLFACQKESPVEPEIPVNEWLEPTENVSGTLADIQGIPLLTLWGTPYEMGYAHGYLYAPELIEYAEIDLGQPGAVDNYENLVLPNIHKYTIPEEYLQEMEGLLHGIEARAGDSVYVAAIDRYLTFDDIIANFCSDNIETLLGTEGCTSFSAWDTATADGAPITAHNYEHPDNVINTGRYILIVRKPTPGTGTLPWISVALPGALHCDTGMNIEGVTLARQQVDDPRPVSATDGFCPEDLLYRKLLESARAASVIDDVSALLQELYTNGGEALLMSWPSGHGDCSAVFEVDGDLTTGHGFTVRQPKTGSPFLIQTNQFYERLQPSHSNRYALINARMTQILDGRSTPLTFEKAWELLGEVPQGGNLLIQHAVVFEPDNMLMHVGFAEPGTHATSGTRITVDVAALLD
ncbi:C45 family autoproteolytic acyltransferase/hydrolase [Candidatus Neomarinimicrobiota bacterium]